MLRRLRCVYYPFLSPIHSNSYFCYGSPFVSFFLLHFILPGTLEREFGHGRELGSRQIFLCAGNMESSVLHNVQIPRDLIMLHELAGTALETQSRSCLDSTNAVVSRSSVSTIVWYRIFASLFDPCNATSRWPPSASTDGWSLFWEYRHVIQPRILSSCGLVFAASW